VQSILMTDQIFPVTAMTERNTYFNLKFTKNFTSFIKGV
jgi:hypothetical protein